MKKKRLIIGALSGLAGTAIKSVFNRVYSANRNKTRTKHKTLYANLNRQSNIQTEENKERTGIAESLLNIGLGTLGGIGAYLFSKNRRDTLSEKIAGGIVLGSTTDLILKAFRRKTVRRRKFSYVLGNSLYGIVTGMVNNALDRYLSDNGESPLEEYVERMRVREEMNQKRTRLRRFGQKEALKKTS